MDCIVHGVEKSWTRLSDFHFQVIRRVFSGKPNQSFKRVGWSGLPFPPPGALSHPGIESTSLASPALAGGYLTTAPLVLEKLVELILLTVESTMKLGFSWVLLCVAFH